MKSRTLLSLTTAAVTGIALTATAGAPPPPATKAPVTKASVTESNVMIGKEALVQLTGRVADMDRQNVWVEYGLETVKVNVRDDIQWYEIYEKDAKDAMRIGEAVTVYGSLDDATGPVMEVDAHALYVPAENTTFFTDYNDRWTSRDLSSMNYYELEPELAYFVP